MAGTVLFVDDEPGVLRSLERVFAGEDLRILTAGGGEEALGILGRENVSVLVSDNMMPGMRGVDLFRRVKSISPDTVKVMLTAYSDLHLVMEAINSGEIFRFVLKPWDNDALIGTVYEALDRSDFLRSLHLEYEAVLCSLAETIELKDPYTKGHCERVAGYANLIAGELGLSGSRCREIRYGSWLHDCGKIGVPEAILNHAGGLDAKEFEVVRLHPGWGAEVARKAGFSPTVINIVLYHHERYDGSGYPVGLAGGDIPLEARIVAVADVYDALTSKRPYHDAHGAAESVRIMRGCRGKALDPELTDMLLRLLDKRGARDD